MKMISFACIAFIITLLLSSVACCAVKTKATHLAEVDFLYLEHSTKSFFGASPDNRSIFYEDYSGGKYSVLVNGKKLTDNDILGWKYPWSHDGRHTAVICRGEDDKDFKDFAVVDGKEVKLNGSINEVTFSPDGKNVAYSYYNGEQNGISLDGKEAKLYDLISPPCFMKGKDGNRLVYTAKVEGKWVLIIDEKERNKYDGIREVVVSPDGTRLAIEALDGGKGFAVIDGKEGKRYDDIDDGIDTLIFSPDSKRVAYVVGKFGNKFVVVDGIEEKSYKYIGTGTGNFVFSTDSKHLAYTGVKDGESAEETVVVLDGKEQEKYGAVSTFTPVFSPDNRLAFLGRTKDNKVFAVFEGKKSAAYDGVTSMVFSSDGKHLGLTVFANDLAFTVIDGKEQKKYNQVSSLALSPDGKHFAYVAQEGDWLNRLEQFVVIDGIECKEDGFFIPDRSGKARIVFDSATKLHFLAQKDKKVYLVEKQLE